MASKCFPVNIHKHDYDVLIMRPSKWGNPFVIGKDGERDEVIDKFAVWIKTQPDLMEALHELRGKRLGCCCYPKRCHGHVLAELVNALEESK